MLFISFFPQFLHFALDSPVDFIQEDKAAAVDGPLSGGNLLRALAALPEGQLVEAAVSGRLSPASCQKPSKEVFSFLSNRR